MIKHKLELHYAGEWAALYEDGKLVLVGDSYASEEEAFRILGVEQIHDESFMRGGSTRERVAKTLTEVEEYRFNREERLAEAARLRTRAAQLLGQARTLEQE